MVQSVPPLEDRMSAGDLIAELAARAPAVGANVGLWPGLTLYRFHEPMAPSWEEVQSLSLCVIGQGRKCVTVGGDEYRYDPFNYLVLSSHLHFQAEILEATVAKPFYSLVLQIDPAIVRKISVEMVEHRRSEKSDKPSEKSSSSAFISVLDAGLMSSVIRFLRALSTGPDRRILAPAYLQEIVYRVLQAEQYERLLEIAAAQQNHDPVARVVAYIQKSLADPLTVADMAEQVSMSPSALSALFRESTGKSPYQFVKEMRLTRARDLLIEGSGTVVSVSRAVGYPSVSHFINEFRRRFGLPPRAYCDLTTLRGELGSGQAGNAHH